MRKRSGRLRVLCPQLYVGTEMRVVGCNRCDNWRERETRCDVVMGCEHLPHVPAAEVPPCPIASECQHQIQSGDAPCPVRARGMICESALRKSGVRDLESHPLGFSAMTVVPEDEWLERQARSND